MSNWQWPQWMMFGLLAISCCYSMAKDITAPTVQKRWTGLIGTFIAQGIQNIPLYFGGFWS